jgi:hypothetical protein
MDEEQIKEEREIDPMGKPKEGQRIDSIFFISFNPPY